MQRPGRPHGGAWQWRWSDNSARLSLLFVALLTQLGACHSHTQPDPAVLFESIRNDFLNGSLDTAQHRAELALASHSGDWSLKFRLQEAEVLANQGRWHQVLNLLTSDGAHFPPEGDLAIKRHLLCALANAGLGQRQQADEELLDAQRLAQPGRSRLYGEVLQTEGVIYLHRRDYPRATTQLRESLTTARAVHDRFLEATDQLNLGFAALAQGRNDEALATLNAAIELARPIHARQVVEVGLGNVGWAYANLGDYEKAIDKLMQAEQQSKEIGSVQIEWLQDVGWSFYKLGDLDDARKYDEQALQAASALDKSSAIGEISTNLGLLAYQQGRLDQAKSYAETALRMATVTQDKNGSLFAKLLQALIIEQQGSTDDAEHLLQALHEASTSEPDVQWDVENVLARLNVARGDIPNARLWFKKSIQTFETRRATIGQEISRLSFFANGEALYRDYAEFLLANHRPTEALLLLDRSRGRTLEEGLSEGAAPSADSAHEYPVRDVKAVARKLNATILFYSLGPETSHLWAITSGDTRVFALPKQSTIESLIAGHQKAILKSDDLLQVESSSLYDTLVRPAAPMIPRGSHVYVIADGALNALNFETLVVPESGAGDLKYWIESVTIQNAHSIQLLASRRTTAVKTLAAEVLLIGDPLAADPQYQALPQAAMEVSSIEKYFSKGNLKVLTRESAIPAAYGASNPARFSYIHFVAHGTASRLSPLDSAVVLSPAPGDPEAFKLYARDIVQFPLNARLVTISACYGSGVRAYAGEGLVGLAWAFLRAGAHDVVASLWDVSDASTPQLMDTFYQQLQGGQPTEAALRSAKLTLIRSTGVYRKPFYWGTFQLYAGT
jgi:CHAT domain-containing protein/tetratricopeptide (TPR) repeat protein